jgi:hypothetical protein
MILQIKTHGDITQIADNYQRGRMIASKDVTKLLKVSRQRVHQLARKNRWPYVNEGRNKLYDFDSVYLFVQSRKSCKR